MIRRLLIATLVTIAAVIAGVLLFLGFFYLDQKVQEQLSGSKTLAKATRLVALHNGPPYDVRGDE